MATQQTAALGLDFGCLSSKLSLAYKSVATSQIQVIRVTLTADLGHPERWNTPTASNSLLEFVAFAALENDKLVPGRHSLNKDESFPLKTILTHRALSRNRTIQGMPGGNQLLLAVSDGRITAEMEDDALRQHFKLLQDMAVQKAEIANLLIETIILTYPNYLCNNEQQGDFEKYSTYYLELIRPIWTHYYSGIRFEMVSEGQAAALYICEPFDDSLHSFDRVKLWKSLKELETRNGLNVFVPGSGSSTLNIQLQSVYFDNDGGVLNSQSNVEPGWRTGAQGGSHISNSIIRDHIRTQLLHHVPQGELAIIMQRFEERKWSLDYYAYDTKPVILMGNDPRFTVHIGPAQIRSAFKKAFTKGLDVLEKEIYRTLALGKDFAVVLCGGSYCSPGLRHQVDDMMAEIVECAKEKGVRVKHLFLANFDATWVSAVSAGAAISVMRLPTPTQVLARSTIAVQKAVKGSKIWRGDSFASVLFREQYGETFPCAKYSNVARTRRHTKFLLVCDPTHGNQHESADGADIISIGQPNKVLNGPLSTYDLGWEVPASELPAGAISFQIGGIDRNRVTHMDTQTDPKENIIEKGQKPIHLTISCCKTEDGKRVPDQNEKGWCLTLKVDPISKLLIVDNAEQVPGWCQECDEVLTLVAHSCLRCDGFSPCDDCLEDFDVTHVAGHELGVVSLGVPRCRYKPTEEDSSPEN